MGGCLACRDKPGLNNSVNEAREVRKAQTEWGNPELSEDFWTNSTVDVENSINVQSQGSISSISTSNLTTNSQGGACISTDPPEFVNHGLVHWNQTRQSWIEKKTSKNCGRRIQRPKLNGHIAESLLGSNKPFPHPIPLAEMVDFLVEIWEEEGLY